MPNHLVEGMLFGSEADIQENSVLRKELLADTVEEPVVGRQLPPVNVLGDHE